ncbi:MAG: DUF4197 domain-containing protein [Nitrospirae bacterium]|nr:MAG: DUF4197 domain-containing protein [Nitrospirota bacterium]
MKRSIFIFGILLIFTASASGGIFDDVKQMFLPTRESSLDNETVVKGLKEALHISTEKAVGWLSRPDGFLKNEAVKILVPEKIRGITNTMRKFGMGGMVDEFEASMNHAAEKAVTGAIPIFKKTIKELTFDDAMKILKGGDTAATDYFREKTYDELFASFRPVVSESMNQVGVTNQYKSLLEKGKGLSPFLDTKEFDLDDYVTEESLDGLFRMMAKEEKAIRTNPAERVTDLLKKVFGSN